MMQISIYKNLYSKVASGEINIARWAEAVKNGQFAEVVEKYRALAAEGKKDEASALKREMMAVTFCGVCKDGRAFRHTTERTGFAMFDFDHLRPSQIRPMKEVLRVCPWVVMAYVTVSGEGLRVVANIGMVAQEDYQQAYVAAAAKLRKLTGAEPDMQCKDFARLSVVSSDPGLYFNPSAEVLEFAKPQAGSVPVRQFPKKIEELKDADAVVARFFDRNPYVEGSRHHTLLKLGRYLRWWGIDEFQLDYVISSVCSFATGRGMTEKEVKDAVRWGFEKGSPRPEGSVRPYGHYNKKGNPTAKCANAASGAEDEEEVIDKFCTNIPAHVYSRLPESLKNLLVVAKDGTERDMLMLSALGMMSGIFTCMRTMYGNRLYSPHLYVAVIAPAGSGKGLASLAMRLGMKIDKRLAARYADEKRKYDVKFGKWDEARKKAFKEGKSYDAVMCPEAPRRQLLSVQPNMSKSQFMLTLRDSGDAGSIVTTSEIDSLNSSLATDYGKHLPELRMAFHHETIGQNYKVDGEPVVVENPRLALVIVGTVQQYMRFVTNVEDGMNSRFLPFVSSGKAEWKSQSPLDGNGGIDADTLVGELGGKLEEFFFANEGGTILVHFTPGQWKRHAERFEELLSVVTAECIEGTEAIVIRGGLIAVRVAMVLCALRLMEDGGRVKSVVCTDDDFDTALEIAANGIKHSIHLTTLYKDQNHRKRMEAFFRKLGVLEGMGETFSYSEFVAKGKRNGFSESAMKRGLKRYLEAGVIERDGSRYRRVKNISRDMYGAE